MERRRHKVPTRSGPRKRTRTANALDIDDENLQPFLIGQASEETPK